MADVKWIKIVTDIFDDEKILLIETLPDADSIIVIWFKLLCLAGKQNNDGVFVMNDKLPYTDKMLSTIFRRNENTVKLAITTFEQFGMIEVIDGVITIPNWGKHQDFSKIEKNNEYMRNYMRDYRKNQKQIACKVNSKPNSKVNVSALDKNRVDKNRVDKSKEYIDGSGEPNSPKPIRHKYGQYANVLLSDEDMDKLTHEFTNDYKDRIERLSEYIESTGKKYKSHLATIRVWAKKDKPAKGKEKSFAELAAEMEEEQHDFI